MDIINAIDVLKISNVYIIRCVKIFLALQDLLTAHLQKIDSYYNGILNNRISIIVIDEAHDLESKVKSASTKYYSSKDIINIVKKALIL